MTDDIGAQAALLLTVSLGKADRERARPLSPGEWARLTGWLDERGLDPSALLRSDLREALSGWDDRSIAPDRLDALLGRGAALGLAMEKWQRAGLWILARSDPGYPTRLAQRLGPTAAPVLFGCGNRDLLERGGLAVVGSRNADDDDLAFSEGLGESASGAGCSIVSGGARGVDRSAMKGALGSGGKAVAVLADSLLRAATSALYRRPLLSGHLALVSTVNPEARFNVGNAMARNRYIYCLADAAVVVASAHGSGGTWNGACENAKAGWVPLWVRRSADPASGTAALLELGARALPDPLESMAALFGQADEASAPTPGGVCDETSSWDMSTPDSTAVAGPDSAMRAIPEDLDFYRLFLARLAEITIDEPLTDADIAKHLGLKKGQAATWRKRGVKEGRVEKLGRPARFRAPRREQALPLGQPAPERPAIPEGLDFPDLFLARLRELTAADALSSTAIARDLDVAPGQVREWLRRGVADGSISEEKNRYRYRRQPP